MTFDKFLWGSATSSHQVEGGNRWNDWYEFETQGHVEGGVQSGKAADHLHLFREDLQVAKSLNLNSYRLSIEWSRVEKSEGEFDEQGFAYYRSVIEHCHALGLEPMVTLHHFTLPLWLSRQGGISSEKFVPAFIRYTDEVISRLGARVRLWCTINEPLVLVLGSYLGRFMPPAQTDSQKASRACANLLRAHVLAYDLIHRRLGTKSPGASAKEINESSLLVGFAHNFLAFAADRRWNPIEQLLAKKIAHLYNWAWLDAISGRKQSFYFPFLFPKSPFVAEAAGRVTTDFIGVNYYTRGLIQFRPRTRRLEQDPEIPIGISFARRQQATSDLGWAIYPKGFARILDQVADYNLPVIVTENGLADRDDKHRKQFIHDHLSVISQTRANVLGYYHWSLVDNFEWIKGYWPRFGLLAVDYQSQARQIRPSANYLARVIFAHEAKFAPKMGTLREVWEAELASAATYSSD